LSTLPSGKLPHPSRTPHFVGCVFFCACSETGIYFVNASHQAGPGVDTRSGSFLLPDAPPAFWLASFLSPVDISAFLAAKSKTQGGETLRLFHFIFEKEIMEK